eukprot:6187689-Pleurochrysis_carterae.AAC.1
MLPVARGGGGIQRRRRGSRGAPRRASRTRSDLCGAEDLGERAHCWTELSASRELWWGVLKEGFWGLLHGALVCSTCPQNEDAVQDARSSNMEVYYV